MTGTWTAYYGRSEKFTQEWSDRMLGMGFGKLRCRHYPNSLEELDSFDYFCPMARLEAESAEDLWCKLQGENWDRTLGFDRAEALSEAMSLWGVGHSSMSVGDVAVSPDGEVFYCEPRGFRKAS